VKAAVVVLSDPAGGEEALGRVFNALAAANDFFGRGETVTVLFQGAGTRWAGVLTDESHPVHGLFDAVRPAIIGASDPCSTFFDSRDGVTAAGLSFVAENEVPGVGGLPSLAALVEAGYLVLTF
jgi:hypothetical protein